MYTMSIEASTLKEYIAEYKQQTSKMSDCFLFEWMDDPSGRFIKVIEENVLAKHTAFLEANKKHYKLTDDEFRMYRYNAHRLSQKLYGTTEFWFLILHANEIYSESEFCSKYIYLYNKNVLDKISEILAVEEDDIKKNRSTVAKEESKIKKVHG